MNESRDVYGNQIQTPDGRDVYTHPVYGPSVQTSYGPEPVSPPPPPPPTTWDNN